MSLTEIILTCGVLLAFLIAYGAINQAAKQKELLDEADRIMTKTVELNQKIIDHNFKLQEINEEIINRYRSLINLIVEKHEQTQAN